VRWLAGFAGVAVEPGRTATVAVCVTRRAFEVWDVAAHGWVTPPGEYRLVVAHDLADERGSLTVHR
jgi:beta-glucosidase